MHLYKPKPRFDSRTGKPINSVLRPAGYVCDYTGEEFDGVADYELEPLYYLKIKYNHDSEPLWYEDKERQILEKQYGVEYGDFSNFLDSTYHFMHTEGFGCADVSMQLVSEWIVAVNSDNSKHPNPLHNCRTIEQAFRVCRLRTLMRLLEEKKYTPVELGFTADTVIEEDNEA